MATQSVDTRWTKAADGSYVMPEGQSLFLDWLLKTKGQRADEGLPETQAAWARAYGVNEKTPREWKVDHRFRAAWDQRAAEKNVSTERVQTMLDALYETALEDRDVAAMKLWLDYSAKMRPPSTVVKEGDYAKLDDEALVKELKSALNV